MAFLFGVIDVNELSESGVKEVKELCESYILLLMMCDKICLT